MLFYILKPYTKTEFDLVDFGDNFIVEPVLVSSKNETGEIEKNIVFTVFSKTTEKYYSLGEIDCNLVLRNIPEKYLKNHSCDDAMYTCGNKIIESIQNMAISNNEPFGMNNRACFEQTAISCAKNLLD